MRAVALARKNPLATLPKAAFEAPVFDFSYPLLGRSLIVSDPQAVRRVLIERPDAYPKSELTRRSFAAGVGEGLFTSEGETWRRQRRLLAPAFDARAVAAARPAMARAAQDGLDRWPLGEPFDVSQALTELTLGVIARALFSGAGETLGPSIYEALRAWEQVMSRFGLSDFVPGLRQQRRLRREAEIAALFPALDGEIAGLVAARRANPGPGDLLDRLVAAEDVKGGDRLSDQELRDQLLTLFIAGHETTATALTWTLCLLAEHPAVEAALSAEAEALGRRAPAAGDLPGLPYARRVIEESMRLFPPLPRLPARQAMEDDQLCGVRIRRGDLVTVAPWVVHRHRRLWDAPERFDPDRFLPERAAARPKLAYIPFGAGPRVCIGAALALDEAVLILAGIVQRGRIRMAQNEPVAMRPRMTLRPEGQVLLTLEPRRCADGPAR